MPKKTGKKPIVTRKQKIAAEIATDYFGRADGSISNANDTVEYLENPTQSDDDKNKYRVIKLSNGLTALLISSPEDIWSEDGDVLTDATENGKFDKTRNTEKDQNAEWFDKLMRKARQESVRATCSLSINVGSFSDPPHIPCVSRILSNVILSSSKKYPQTNSFENFLEKYDSLVVTSEEHCELTTFYFYVPMIHLHAAMDRFSNCFINPALPRDAIMKERDVIEKEYEQYDLFFNWIEQKNRLFDVLATSTDSHPGNTLGGKYGPALFRKTRERLWEEVNKFMKRHYSANRMTVLIKAALPLDNLEYCARKYFSKISNNGLPPVDMSTYSYDRCFDMTAFNLLYEIELPCKDFSQIEFNWPMPSSRSLYRSKPHRYIMWLINNVSPGSLISYLRKKKWCTAIRCGIGTKSFEPNTIYSILTLSLDLTIEGCKNQTNIINAVYSYVNFLKLEGIEKRVYDEIRRMEEARFRTKCGIEWGSTHGELSKNMQIYPSRDYLTGNILCHVYDPKTIKFCLDCMSPEKCNLTLYGKNTTGFNWTRDNFDIHCDTEKLDEYKKFEIPKNWLEKWKKIAPMSCFKLPDSNIFCPDDFNIIPVPENSPLYPVKIHSDSLYEVWHKLDDKFRKPQCKVFLLYINSTSFESAENAAMLHLFVKILKKILSQKLYAAISAGMTFSIDSGHTGIMIDACGYNNKLPLLMQKIGEYIGNCSILVSEKLFDVTKNEQIKEYHQNCMSTDQLTADVKFSILRPFHRTNIEKHAATSAIKFDKFKHFVSSYTDHVYVQSLVQGNIGQSDALDIVRNCIGASKCGPLLPDTKPQYGILIMPRGARCCRLRSFKPSFETSDVTNYYQFGEKTILMTAAIDLLLMLIEDPMFAVPRSRERLDDYRISASADLSCLVAYSLTLRNFFEKTSIGSVELKIEQYRRALGKMLKELSTIEWALIKRIYNKLKRTTDKNLHNEMCRNWGEIMSSEYIYDRNIREAETIARMEIEELRKLIFDLTTIGPNNRKLSIQIIDRADIKEKKCNKNVKNIPSSKELKLKLLTDSSVVKEGKSAYYITDIPSYKSTLETFVLDKRV